MAGRPMREYGKVAPQFWVGDTGKKLRKAGAEAQVVALYLMTCPHANMLGLYYVPIMYIAHETGLGMEGASKGLQRAIEAGFCEYDEASEVVWVHEMAKYQIAKELAPTDKRSKGVQNEYDALPANPYLARFFEKYRVAFRLTKKRGGASPSEAPSMPLASQEQEQEQEQEKNPPIPPKGGEEAVDEKLTRGKRSAVGLPAYLQSCKQRGVKSIPEGDAVFAYAEQVGVPLEFLRLHWLEFKARYCQPDAKRYKDWAAVHRKSVRGNWFRLWFIGGDGQVALTTVGEQARRLHGDAA